MFKKKKLQEIVEEKVKVKEPEKEVSEEFVTELDYNNAFNTINRAIRLGQLGNNKKILAIGVMMQEGNYYHYANGPMSRFYQVDPLKEVPFKTKEVLKTEERKELDTKLAMLKDEINKKVEEIEEIGKKLGDL